MSDLTSLRLQNTLGGNRRKKPFAFGLPMPDEEDTFDESSKNVTFGAENDIPSLIKSVRPSNGLNADDVDPVYTRETEATERFRQLLDKFPERGEPSFLDKLAGAGAYLGNKSRGIPGGFKAAEEAKYAGYNRELEDWKEQTGPTYNAANLERYANATERQAVGQELRDKQATRAQTERERAALEKEEIARGKQAIERAKAQGAKFTTRGDEIIAMFPDGRAVPTGVKTTNYSPFELEELRQKGRIAVVQEQGTEARKTDAQRAAEALILEAQKDRADAEQARIKAAAGGSDVKQDELNKQRSAVVEALARSYPDTFKKHIRQNTSTGEFELRPRPVAGVWPWSDDPTEEQAEWDALNKLVYERVQPTPNLSLEAIRPSGTQQAPPSKPPSGPGFQFGPGTNPGFGGVTEGQPPPPTQFFPTPKPPVQQQQSRPGVPPGEVLLMRISDGGLLTAREENAQAMIATGKYELVQ